MKLQSISYSEWENNPQAWRITDLAFGDRNLLVGRNASGKSRSLAIIGALAGNLTGFNPPAQSGSYKCVFDNDGEAYVYEVAYREGAVVRERVEKDGRELLSRGPTGIGKIIAEKVNSDKPIDFQTPTNAFAAFARRDSVQHSFLEPLASWADSLRFYHFAGNLGKGVLAHFVPGTPAPSDRDEHAVVPLFRQAEREFPNAFAEVMKSDLRALDYPIDYITTGAPITLRVNVVAVPPGFPSAQTPPSFLCLHVKESGLEAITDQYSMSDGMFRVVALLIHVNLALLRGSATTILIDDIGEGLDFERSIALIQLLRDKASQSNIQLIMTTNDRFVMNKVPLEEWTVLHRRGQEVIVRNYGNSKDHFDNFMFTGLSNFSFFEMNVSDLATYDSDDDEENDEDDDA
ncbi:AAA family ATPase [Burkholderia multivorans]|uniref:AAA family ATPase n=1 Tax=Burkholderia multivorans TaxID=87883 RepID=UPI00264E038A|nr:AAA family ATPase [Burkholderia multivorans]MDN7759721.1 AAA family ATPase [Burkholderia multivorans]MEB2510783.1 AAA family ATPase [Burkholderia multivorans]MEB2520770.1 AAA family ATPase [Burkholderia multivorans]MEB2573072.1 AAA family ATPase [Burkholderia multivorans]MEB2594847.1 AAA family ATPase [Burkholderia multivorans]